MSLYAIIDGAVSEALKAQPDLLSQKGKESDRAHKFIVRKVTKALRESMSPQRDDDEVEVPAADNAGGEPQSKYWLCETWSKEWWALFFTKIERRQSVAFMLDQAIKSERGSTFPTPFDQQPSRDLIDRMAIYPSDGKAVSAWRIWLARKGVRLPEWRNKVWLFLPDPDPPESSAA